MAPIHHHSTTLNQKVQWVQYATKNPANSVLVASNSNQPKATVQQNQFATKTSDSTKNGTGTVTASKLNVRALPAGNSEIVGQLKKGQLVKIVRGDNNFLQIEYRGRLAFVAARFVNQQDTNIDSSTVKKLVSLLNHFVVCVRDFTASARERLLYVWRALPIRAAIISICTSFVLKLLWVRVRQGMRRISLPSVASIWHGSAKKWLIVGFTVAGLMIALKWRTLGMVADVITYCFEAAMLFIAWRVILCRLKTTALRFAITPIAIPLIAFTVTLALSCLFDRQVKEGLSRFCAPSGPTIVYSSTSGAAHALPVERAVTSSELHDSAWMAAAVAIEDERLQRRWLPIDFWSLGRALWRDLHHEHQGGSTIPMQVAKMLTGRTSSTLADKPRQLLLTLRFWQLYPNPEEEVAIYSNLIELSGHHRGVAYAAERFFGVASVADLNPQQSAILAGMLRNPTHYDPRFHAQESLRRRNLVLAKMFEQGFLSSADYRLASASPLGLIQYDHNDEMLFTAARGNHEL